MPGRARCQRPTIRTSSVDDQGDQDRPAQDGYLRGSRGAGGGHAFGAIQTRWLPASHGGGSFIEWALMDSMINCSCIELPAAQLPDGTS